MPIISATTLYPGGSAGKESTYNVGDLGSIPELGRSPAEGQGISLSLQFWPGEFHGLYIVHGVAKSRTQLSNFHFTLSLLL